MKKETPKVLQLYAPHTRRLDTPIEMRVKIFPYTSQAHFLLTTLDQYRMNWKGIGTNNGDNHYTLLEEGINAHTRKIEPPVASLEDNLLTTTVSEIQLARMFLGFNPSAQIIEKLREMSIDDERTLQILRRFSDFDQTVAYAYWVNAVQLGTHKSYNTLVTKKEDLNLLTRLIPPGMFFKPIHYNEIEDYRFSTYVRELMKDSNKYGSTPPLRKKLSTEKIQGAISESDRPFIILQPGASYNFPITCDHNPLPPEDLSKVDCFPHKNLAWKKFLLRQGEYNLPEDLLLQKLKPHS